MSNRINAVTGYTVLDNLTSARNFGISGFTAITMSVFANGGINVRARVFSRRGITSGLIG